MKQLLLLSFLVSITTALSAQVENKAFSKNYSLSSAVSKTYIVDPNFDLPLSEAGTYLIVLEANAVVPSVSANGCSQTGFWNFGHVFVFNKTTGVSMSPAAGEYKWIYDQGANTNCAGAYSIPTSTCRTYIANFQAGARLGIKCYSEKIGVIAASWQYSGKVIAVRLN